MLKEFFRSNNIVWGGLFQQEMLLISPVRTNRKVSYTPHLLLKILQLHSLTSVRSLRNAKYSSWLASDTRLCPDFTNIDEVVFRCIKEEMLTEEKLWQEHFADCKQQNHSACELCTQGTWLCGLIMNHVTGINRKAKGLINNRESSRSFSLCKKEKSSTRRGSWHCVSFLANRRK